jgi:hypothetical protein
MRTKSRSAAVTLVLVAALAATGCTPEAPRANEKPTPTTTPLFASDEEALAAAEEAYAAYQSMEDQVLADGGRNPDRIRPFAVREALQAALDGFASFEAEQYRGVGSTGFEIIGLQSTSQLSDAEDDVVTVYLCLDFSRSDVVNANGESVVRDGRALRQQFEAGFDAKTDDKGLILSSREPWTGNDQCAA